MRRIVAAHRAPRIAMWRSIVRWGCCTKGVVYLRRADDGVGAGGRAAGRVDGRGAGEAMGARPCAHLWRGPAPLRASHDPGHDHHRAVLLRPLRPHVLRRGSTQSQLGHRCRYVAGKILEGNGGCDVFFLV